MVLPLLGLVGAGYIGKSMLDPYLEGYQERQRGKRIDAAVGGLLEDPNASSDDVARGMVGAGLLSPSEFMSGGFQERHAGIEHGYSRDLNEQQFGLNRQLQNERFAHERQGWGLTANANAQAAQAEFDQGLITEFQPQFDALGQQFGQYQELGTLYGQLEELGAGSASRYGTPEGQQLWAQIGEREAELFYDWKRQVYGDAEPPERELSRLREAFPMLSFQSGPGGLVLNGLNPVTPGILQRQQEINARRMEDVQKQAQELDLEVQRRRDAYGQGTPMMPGTLIPGVSVNTGPLLNNESGYNPAAYNADTGASGILQAIPARLEDAKRAGVIPASMSSKDFREDPDAQARVTQWHFLDIEEYIDDQGLDEFEGARIGGVPVTMEGMVYVAHLGGKAGLRKFLMSGGKYDPADSNGTRLSDYLMMGARAAMGRSA